MDKKHYESRHDRREERADHYDSPRAPEEDMGLNGVEKSSRHDGRDKDRKKSSRTEDKDHRSKDTERGKDRIKDIKGKDKDHDRDRSREKERERDKEKDRKDRGKEKERDRGREMDKERGKDKNRDRERAKDKEREADQGKERSRERDGKSKEDMQEDPEYDGRKNVLMSSIDGDQKNAERSSTGGQTSTSELRERIMKMKEERSNKSEAGSEILSWVNKTRKLEEKRNIAREKAKRLSKNFEEQDNLGQGESDDEDAGQNHTHDLAGVKVLDGLDKVVEGGAVVLTLKDQSILADGDINNEVDMLENVEIGEQKRRDDAYKAAKKPAGVYSDKFNDDPMTERKMLPQYDEPVDEGVTLDNMGHFSGEAEKKLDELRKRLQGGTTNNRAEDLNSSGKILSDYYSQEEMIQFKKPKKKKSLRKKDKLDIKALEQEAISEGLGAGDLGSRNDSRRKAREEQERHEAEMRNAAYQLAYAKADEASKALQLGHTIPASNEDIDDVMADEEDDDLHKSVERARKLALEKQKDVLVGPEAVARLAATLKSNQVTDDQNAATEEGQEGKVVFTEIEEFVWGLQFDEDAQKDDTNDVFKDEDDAIVVSHEEGEVMADGLKEEANEAVKDEDTTMEDVKEVAGDGIIHEVPVGKGLSGALKLLHDRGTLKESINWGGRNMDKKKSKLVGIVDNDDGKGKEKKNKDKDMDRFEHVSLERTDEFGRTLTPKEAFRIISHRFHGKGPGKMKQEKRIKQFQEELKLKQMKNSDTPSLSVQRMRETQAQLKTPYLVLSGHVKPGQTSDPRSGFATVEKELPGGLTPMLGDKKVEHFLGIKRKPDAGTDSGAPKKPRT
ncbi:SART-1 family protein DOT2 [Linum perenne]